MKKPTTNWTITALLGLIIATSPLVWAGSHHQADGSGNRFQRQSEQRVLQKAKNEANYVSVFSATKERPPIAIKAKKNKVDNVTNVTNVTNVKSTSYKRISSKFASDYKDQAKIEDYNNPMDDYAKATIKRSESLQPKNAGRIEIKKTAENIPTYLALLPQKEARSHEDFPNFPSYSYRSSWEVRNGTFTPLEHSGIEWLALEGALEECYDRSWVVCIIENTYRDTYEVGTFKTTVAYTATVLAHDIWLPYYKNLIFHERVEEKREDVLGELQLNGVIMDVVRKGIRNCKRDNATCYLEDAFLDTINKCKFFGGCKSEAHAYFIGGDYTPFD